MSYARIWHDINSDDDFTALSFDAQAFYVRVALIEPSLNKCGVGDWRPARLTARAPDLTVDRIHAAAYELEQAGYLLFDLDTEEYLVRSLIRRDELIRNPKVSVSVVADYSAIYSPILRAAVVSELQRDRKENPEYSGWTYKGSADGLARILESKNLDTVGYEPRITPPEAPPEGVSDTPPFGVSEGVSQTDPKDYPKGQTEGYTETDQIPHPNPIVPPKPKPKPKPYQGVRMPTDVQTARTTDPNDPPPPTCPQHPNGTDEPCSGCRRARQTRKRYDAQRLDAEQGAARAQAEATSRAAHEHANLQAAEIAACDLCDENGYRHTPDGTSSAPCRHNPDDLERNAAAAKAAKAALRADLERKALGENPDTPANHTQPDRG